MSPEVRVSAAVKGAPAAAAVARLAGRVLAAEGVRAGSVSLTFVGRRRIRSLNREYLGRDRATDVIAFAMAARPVVADIYICPEVAQRNARAFGATPRRELLRLVVHGVLHVLGHDHPDGGREASAMWRRQERYLRRFAAS